MPDPERVPPRLAAVAVALVLAGWFVVGVRQAHNTAAANAFLTAHQTLAPDQAKRVSRLIDAAAALNPDTQISLLRARVLLAQGQRVRARAAIETVTRSEPMNIEAWLWLARASAERPATFLRALVAINRLEPRVRSTQR